MLHDIYTALLIDYCKIGRDTKCLACEDIKIEAHNPLCGDRLVLGLEKFEDKTKTISVVTNGCAISLASGAIGIGSIIVFILNPCAMLFAIRAYTHIFKVSGYCAATFANRHCSSPY